MDDGPGIELDEDVDQGGGGSVRERRDDVPLAADLLGVVPQPAEDAVGPEGTELYQRSLRQSDLSHSAAVAGVSTSYLQNSPDLHLFLSPMVSSEIFHYSQHFLNVNDPSTELEVVEHMADDVEIHSSRSPRSPLLTEDLTLLFHRN